MFFVGCKLGCAGSVGQLSFTRHIQCITYFIRFVSRCSLFKEFCAHSVSQDSTPHLLLVISEVYVSCDSCAGIQVFRKKFAIIQMREA